MGEIQNVDRERIIYDYKHSIIQSVEHDNHGPATWTYVEVRDCKVLREQYSERSRQLDENEETCKKQYDNNHCEKVTGLSSDDFRHQVIEDYTHEQMAGKGATESQGGDYWSDSAAATSADTQGEVQAEHADYWANGSAENSIASQRENGLSNEAHC